MELSEATLNWIMGSACCSASCLAGRRSGHIETAHCDSGGGGVWFPWRHEGKGHLIVLPQWQFLRDQFFRQGGAMRSTHQITPGPGQQDKTQPYQPPAPKEDTPPIKWPG